MLVIICTLFFSINSQAAFGDSEILDDIGDNDPFDAIVDGGRIHLFPKMSHCDDDEVGSDIEELCLDLYGSLASKKKLNFYAKSASLKNKIAMKTGCKANLTGKAWVTCMNTKLAGKNLMGRKECWKKSSAKEFNKCAEGPSSTAEIKPVDVPAAKGETAL